MLGLQTDMSPSSGYMRACVVSYWQQT